ncbi:hypothetical protein [Prosthecomicrobium sp. N25]|uniref:hypothetical protein n=1 Tax=Prosthecomicrobium sp. N25 TaxID=3129254 RepID=UPI0030777C49
MSGTEIARHIPYLRRFARALAGSKSAADAEIGLVLQALIDGRVGLDPDLPLRAALFQAFCSVVRPTDRTGQPADGNSFHETQLRGLEPLARRAYLLVVMEQFGPDEAAAILGVSAERVEQIVSSVEARMARTLGMGAVESLPGDAIRVDPETPRPGAGPQQDPQRGRS